MRVFICHRIVFIWWTSVDALEVFIWTFFRHYFWIFRTLFNCFKIIIYAAYSVPLCLNALRHLALYLEDRNDISDKVQTMNSDCCLMELIYSFFFSFLPFFFFLVLSVCFREILTGTTCFVHAYQKPLSPCWWVLWISQTWWGGKMMLIPLCNVTLCLSERYYLGKCYLWKRSNIFVLL